MSLKASLIQLPRRSELCFKCQNRLIQGSEYYSLLLGEELFGGKSSDCERRDYCSDCWTHEHFEANSKGTHWKSSLAKKKLAPEKSLKREEKALELLKEAMDLNQSILTSSETYFLALYLARKRILQLKKETMQWGESFQLFEVVETDELLAIKKINLHQVNIAELQVSLAEKLKIQTD